MKTLLFFALFFVLPYVAHGQSASSDSTLEQVRARKSQIATLKHEIDSIIARSDIRAASTLYGEIGGAAILFSANFESRFPAPLNKNLSWRVGLGLNTTAYYSNTYSQDRATGEAYTFFGIANAPLMLNYFTDGDGSPYHFEAGVGIIPWYGYASLARLTRASTPFEHYNATPLWSSPQFRGYVPVSLGYRYQPVDGGFFFKVSAMAIFGGGVASANIFPWIGFSFGETYSVQ